uniref:Uncharacterized protein n=1 Tax=Plectus sambesii TaxID=2011161 RepID=A0A914UV39_9BILA
MTKIKGFLVVSRRRAVGSPAALSLARKPKQNPRSTTPLRARSVANPIPMSPVPTCACTLPVPSPLANASAPQGRDLQRQVKLSLIRPTCSAPGVN